MTIPQISELIYKQSHGLISIEDSAKLVTAVYNNGHTIGYQNGYRQCSIDRRKLKELSRLINMDLVNEFMEKCIKEDIFEMKQLIKNPALLQQYKDLFNADVIF